MKRKETKVLSFRVPIEVAKKVDKQAGKQKKLRAEYIAGVFMPAFEQEVQQMQKKCIEPVKTTLSKPTTRLNAVSTNNSAINFETLER